MNRTGRCAVNLMLIIGLLLAHVAAVAALDTPLRLADQRIVAVPRGMAHELSPDGRFLVASRMTDAGSEICALETATLADAVCADLGEVRVGRGTAVWSPDGSRVAFTEDAVTFFAEADLWIFDVGAGTVVNLTDDGFAGMVDDAPPGTPVDVAPAWSPDGTELVFARSTSGGGAESTVLSRVSASGGQVTEIVTVAPVRLAVPAGVHWTAADEILYYVVDADGGTNGLWSVPAAGGAARRIVGSPDLGFADPIVLADVASHSQAGEENRALVVQLSQGVVFAVVSLETGDAEIVEPGGEGMAVAAATFSPDGSQLLMSVWAPRQRDTPHRLIVRDLASGEDSDLGALESRLGALYYRGGMTWSSGGIVFGTGGAMTGLVVEIEPT